MTARIISAAEARALLEAATPGPWSVDVRVACAGVVAPALVRSQGLGRDYDGVIAFWSPPPGVALNVAYPRWSHEQPGDMDLIAAAPDLAASVVALHAEVDRIRKARRLAASAERGRIVAWLRAWADAYQPKYSVYPDDCRDLADRIERGEVTP